MKKITTLIAITISLFIANANTITVSNNLNSPGQYTDLQVAIDATTTLSGDTILVAGSQISYGDITVSTKQIHLIGIGYDPSKQMAYDTELGSIEFKRDVTNFSLNSNGSTITGFKIGYITLEGDYSAGYSSGYVISRCNITGSITMNSYTDNVLIYNNIIYDIVKPSNSNFTSNYIVSNNVLTYSIQQKHNISNGQNASGFLVLKNNLFLATFGILGGYNLVAQNNVFKGFSPYSAYVATSEYTNNLSYNTSNDTFNTTGTNSGSGNIIGQDPLFISETNNIFDNTDDFHTPSTSSPVHNAGTDGTDIGIYGGSYPWPDGGISGSGFMYSQEPQFPQVNEMNINNITVPSGGTLNVTAKGIVNH